MKCSECESLSDVSINIDDIGTPEVKSDNQVMLTDTVGVVLKYPSFESISKLGDELDTVDGAFKMVASCIDTIFDEDNVYDAKSESSKNIQEFLENLNSDQFKMLTGFFENMPALTHNLNFKCEHCGHENEMELKGLQSFFT